MTISDSTVAIIGAGNIGSRLAADFAVGGQDFLLAGRDAEAARKIASDLDGHAEVVSVDEAVERAGVLVVAVWLDDFKQFIAQYGAAAGRQGDRRPVEPGRAGRRRRLPQGHRRAGVLGPDPGRRCCRPEPGWSRRSARYRPRRCPRPPGKNPTGWCCSMPPTTTRPATWSRT